MRDGSGSDDEAEARRQAEINAVVYGATLPAVWYQRIFLYGILNYEGEPCPTLENAEGGGLTISGQCTDQSGNTYSGSATVTGATIGDDGFIDMPVAGGSVEWNQFSVEQHHSEGDYELQRVSGAQEWTGDAYSSAGGVLEASIDVFISGAEETWQGVEDRTFEVQDFSGWYAAPNGWALSSHAIDQAEIDARLSISDLGPWSVQGAIVRDASVCNSEPVAGELLIEGSWNATLRFDGDSKCDGLAPYDGNVGGEYATALWYGCAYRPTRRADGRGRPFATLIALTALMAWRRRCPAVDGPARGGGSETGWATPGRRRM